MKRQGTGNMEQGIAAGAEEAGEVKPKAKARKKKVAEPVEGGSGEIVTPQTDDPEAKAKPAKRAAKKAKAAVAEAEQETAAESGTLKAKRVAKPRRDKGRELVVDEPGTAEIAAVLGEHHNEAPGGEDADEAGDSGNAAPLPSGPEPKLERLQKILAKAGISSRRKAEELILGGLVQINGKVVMELGTKADPARDHIRVNGKLLQGPERIRYFVLNKPKGYVTTVSDPEGRPTVMQFFAHERERLYPVGRLDYLSEGLLLVTNDGELANKLTKASSGVEKTYLVKVAGQPTEDMLDALRGGVVIEKGRPGTYSGRVRTAPAKIRQVREGDNPWYEVIIIEGRNRELRKMFEEIGHHVEKIRRVGYGPLILDLEPGKLRELEPEEVHSLRLASEGKLKTRRRRGPKEAQLPTVAGKTVRYKKADGRPGFEPRTRPVERAAVRPEFQTESKAEFKPHFRQEIKAGFKREPKPEFKAGFKKEFNADRRPGFSPGRELGGKPGFRGGPSPVGRGNFGAKPRRVEPPVTDYVLPPRKSAPEPEFDDRTGASRGEFNPDYKPGFRAAGSAAGRPGSRPAFRQDGPPKRFGGDKPFRPASPKREFTRPPADDDDFVPRKTPGFKIEPVEEKPRGGRSDRPAAGGRSFSPHADSPRPQGRTSAGFAGGAKSFRPAGGRPAPGGRPAGGDRPFRPRADGPPSGGAKPFRPRPSGSAPVRTGPPRSGQANTGEFRPRKEFRPGGERPARFAPRAGGQTDGPPARRPKPFESVGDAPREFRPRESRPRESGGFAKGPGGPKKFGGAKPFGAKKFDGPKPTPGGRNSVPSNRLGPDGQPRVKVRARDSFTGKNKGRPKPKPKKEE
jgi:23S rRNA pseudouridine2605 synthase